jgi:hypothetical protein
MLAWQSTLFDVAESLAAQSDLGQQVDERFGQFCNDMDEFLISLVPGNINQNEAGFNKDRSDKRKQLGEDLAIMARAANNFGTLKLLPSKFTVMQWMATYKAYLSLGPNEETPEGQRPSPDQYPILHDSGGGMNWNSFKSEIWKLAETVVDKCPDIGVKSGAYKRKGQAHEVVFHMVQISYSLHSPTRGCYSIWLDLSSIDGGDLTLRAMPGGKFPNGGAILSFAYGHVYKEQNIHGMKLEVPENLLIAIKEAKRCRGLKYLWTDYFNDFFLERVKADRIQKQGGVDRVDFEHR